jgi:hypothetical protein
MKGRKWFSLPWRSQMKGRKDDQGKLPYDLIAPEFLEATAEILKFGAAKYEPRNWEDGMAWSRPYSALQRHMWAWWGGEDNDSETDMSHLWHAACCIMFLIAYEQRGIGEDNRSTKNDRREPRIGEIKWIDHPEATRSSQGRGPVES